MSKVTHLGLSKLPLLLGPVMECQQICALFFLISTVSHRCLFLFIENDLIPDVHKHKIINVSQKTWVNKNCFNPYLVKKSLKVRLTGNPALRIFTVSNMPEYRNWFRTTSGSNLFGLYRREKTFLKLIMCVE